MTEPFTEESFKNSQKDLPSLDQLPSTKSGKFGLDGEKQIDFTNTEEHQLYLLGKLKNVFPKVGIPSSEWDALYNKVKKEDKILVLRGYFDSIDEEIDKRHPNKIRSVSVLSPGFDVVTRPSGVVYEVNPKSLQILFSRDCQIKREDYPDSKSALLPNGETIYYRDWANPIKLSDLSHLVLPRQMRSCTEALLTLPEDTQIIAIYDRLGKSGWREKAKALGKPLVSSVPNLDHSGQLEIFNYESELARNLNVTNDEVSQKASGVFKSLSNG